MRTNHNIRQGKNGKIRGKLLTEISTPVMRMLLGLVGVCDRHRSRSHHISRPELILYLIKVMIMESVLDTKFSQIWGINEEKMNSCLANPVLL